ncbi:MAG: hypothetical protein ACRBFS_08655 [Aureispira sp.]
MLDQHQIEQLLLPRLQTLEKERTVLHKQIKNYEWQSDLLMIAGIISVPCLLFWTGTNQLLSSEFVTIIVTFFCVGIFMAIHHVRNNLKVKQNTLRAKFEQQVKSSVYQEVFKTWNTTINYSPNQCIDQQDFERAGLHKNYSIYQGDDYCTGQLADGRTFHFSELLTQRVVEHTTIEGEYSSHKVPVFKGLFFMLEDTVPFEGFTGRVQIQPTIPEKKTTKKKAKSNKKVAPKKYIEGILDADFSNSSTLPSSSTSKAPLPSLFDRTYTVDGFGDRAAREKLPVDFCQQLSYLRSLLQQQISVSFYDNKAYFTTRHQLDFWPVTADHSLLHSARVRYVASNFRMAFMLLEKIADVTTIDSSTT